MTLLASSSNHPVAYRALSGTTSSKRLKTTSRMLNSCPARCAMYYSCSHVAYPKASVAMLFVDREDCCKAELLSMCGAGIISCCVCTSPIIEDATVLAPPHLTASKIGYGSKLDFAYNKHEICTPSTRCVGVWND